MVRTFTGTHVAITGGGSGIGLELARQFVRHGAVAVSLLDISDCTGIVADLLAESAGSCSVKCYHADVTEYQQVQQALASAERQQARCIDVLVANAGVGPCGLFLEADVSHWAAVCSINFLGVVHTLKAGVPAMVARGAGRVLVINSTGGFMGAPLIFYPYMLLSTGVTLHMACPGFVDTPMIRKAQKAASDNVKKLKATFVPAMMTAAQVAEHTVRGLAGGDYIIGSPDKGANMLVGSSLAATSARFYPVWLECLLAPAFVLMHWAIRRAVEAATRRVLAPNQAPVPDQAHVAAARRAMGPRPDAGQLGAPALGKGGMRAGAAVSASVAPAAKGGCMKQD